MTAQNAQAVHRTNTWTGPEAGAVVCLGKVPDTGYSATTIAESVTCPACRKAQAPELLERFDAVDFAAAVNAAREAGARKELLLAILEAAFIVTPGVPT